MRQAGAGVGCADSDTGAVDLVQWPEHLFLSGLVANPPRRGEVCRLKGCFFGAFGIRPLSAAPAAAGHRPVAPQARCGRRRDTTVTNRPRGISAGCGRPVTNARARSLRRPLRAMNWPRRVQNFAVARAKILFTGRCGPGQGQPEVPPSEVMRRRGLVHGEVGRTCA